MKTFGRLILFALTFYSVYASASSATYVYNPNPLRFTLNGKKYQVSPQRFQAKCDSNHCYFKANGQMLQVPHSQLILLGKAINGSSGSTEASAPCTECGSGNRSSGGISALPSNSYGFISPVSGRISSRFGMRRHPIKGGRRMHYGVDIAGNNGQTVRAVKSGTVSVKAGCRRNNNGCNGGAGNMVTINHGDGTVTRYMHLNPSCPLPRNGSRVSQGQSIGCVGSTGAVTGAHLHFELWVNGQAVDPLNYISIRNN